MKHPIRYAPRPTTEAIKLAEEKGMAIVYANSYILQIDIDSEEAYVVFNDNIKMLREVTGWSLPYEEHFSTSGYPKRHITINLPFFINIEGRIALQACLGSDLKREMLNFIRIFMDDPYPIIFFEPAPAKTKDLFNDNFPF